MKLDLDSVSYEDRVIYARNYIRRHVTPVLGWSYHIAMAAMIYDVLECDLQE